MTAPPEPSARRRRRPAFSLRRLMVFFGLVALLLCIAGLSLQLVVRTAGERPSVAVAAGALLVVAVLILHGTRRRRAARRLAANLSQLTREAVEAGAAEQERAAASVPDDEEAPDTFEAGDLAAMDPEDFEQAVAALCERDGCRDVEVVGGAGDLGADVIAIAPDGTRVVIQCKRYGPENKVGSQDVQRFGGTCFAVHGAAVAAVVTTGEFTRPAADYAAQCGIRCLDHADLVAWTEGAGPAPWEGEAPRAPTPPAPASGTREQGGGAGT
ncbi:restriction endonuclease [Streptomyces peucetius]|uniref:Restriction endonuclease n=1 Tax=Streptomyces peucetius TaxID=1950 RepID=A0ABY6IHR8_STRPE|nr:restriction endonuclease [Streptomyces peucetius]UYQ65452.1 restriction endonuclease [Streptomyces peucetius]